jgi:hypothetical protein
LANRGPKQKELTLVASGAPMDPLFPDAAMCTLVVRAHSGLRHRVAVRVLNQTAVAFRVSPAMFSSGEITVLEQREIVCDPNTDTRFEYEIPSGVFTHSRPLLVVHKSEDETIGVVGEDLSTPPVWYGVAGLGAAVLGAAAALVLGQRQRRSSEKPSRSQTPAQTPQRPQPPAEETAPLVDEPGDEYSPATAPAIQEQSADEPFYEPAAAAPISEGPDVEVPFEQAPFEQASFEEASFEEAPFEQGPFEQALLEPSPTEATPLEPTPIEEEPILEEPIAAALIEEDQFVEAPIVETPIVEAPIVETPIVEAPIAETPIVETPIVETHIDEAPSEEEQVVEPPAAQTPVAEALTIEQAPATYDDVVANTLPAVAPDASLATNPSGSGQVAPANNQMDVLEGAFAAMAFGDDQVAAALECVRTSFTGFEFVAKVVNQTDLALWCSIVGRSGSGEGIFFPESFWIEPQGAACVPISTPREFPWRLRRLVLNMRNASLECNTEAAVPVPPIVAVARWVGLALLAALIVIPAAFFWARPRVEALVAPQTVLAGGIAPVGYALAGLGHASYQVTDADGAQSSSALPIDGHGFSFATSAKPQAYQVAVNVAGPLGAQEQSVVVQTVAVPRDRANGAAIQVLEASPAVVASGQPIVVRYRTQASTGRVALLDAFGLQIQSQGINGSGVNTFAAPRVAAATPYRVELDVTSNGMSSGATTGVLVLPVAPTQAGSPLPDQLGVAPAEVPAASIVRVDPQYLRAGQPFTVQVLRHFDDMQITLQDEQGAPLASHSIQNGQTSAIFQAPIADRYQKITLVISYKNGTTSNVELLPLGVHATEFR